MENSSKFSNLYKCHNTKNDLQEKRRKLLLNEQKENRSKLQDNLRGIKDFVRNIRQRKHHHYKRPTYSEKYDSNLSLQLSEWLKEQPEDLNHWYLVPCPKGRRCLLIASDGSTEVYSKNGKFVKSLHTLLPGDKVSRQQVTILDCIFIEKLSKYYVLDILVYANQDFINCETEFRFFWIKSKFSDDSLPERCESNNDYPFIPLLYYNFDNELSIESCLSKYPQWDDENLVLDGFLFYHKEASYTCGSTPLVGWLFGFMIPEILHINVNEKYLNEKPKDYVDYLHYINVFDENMSKRNNKIKKKCNKNIKSDDDFIEVNPDDSNESSNFMEILDTEKNLELEGRLFDDIEEINE